MKTKTPNVFFARRKVFDEVQAVPVIGTPVVFAGFEEYEFFAYCTHLDHTDREAAWHVCERQTGYAVAEDRTFEDTVTKSQERLERAGKAKLKSTVTNLLNQYGELPRVTCKVSRTKDGAQ